MYLVLSIMHNKKLKTKNSTRQPADRIMRETLEMREMLEA